MHIYPTFSRLDGIGRTQHPPATAERQPRTENTQKSRLKARSDRKIAENSVIYNPCSPLQSLDYLKISLKRSSKNVKKLYKVTFFKILAFFAEKLTTSKYNHCNRLKTCRPSAGQQRPQTAPQTPDP